MTGPRRDLTGDRRGHLTAVRVFAGPAWLWTCDCGKGEYVGRLSDLRELIAPACGACREKIGAERRAVRRESLRIAPETALAETLLRRLHDETGMDAIEIDRLHEIKSGSTRKRLIHECWSPAECLAGVSRWTVAKERRKRA